MKPENRTAIIIRLFGSQSALGRALGLRQSTVWEWTRLSAVPSRRIPEIIAAAARLDPPVHLTPNDFFDVPVQQAAAAFTQAQPSP